MSSPLRAVRPAALRAGAASRRRRHLWAALVTIATSLTVAAGALGATPVVSLSGGVGGTPVANSVHGWEFVVNAPIRVTHLGLHDQGEDGLAIHHPIGLFRLSDSLLLTSGELSAGTGDPLIDGFRYVDTPDLVLSVGETYVVSYFSATAFADLGVISQFTSFAIDPSISIVAGRNGLASGLALPENISIGPTSYGPNLLVEFDPPNPTPTASPTVVPTATPTGIPTPTKKKKAKKAKRVKAQKIQKKKAKKTKATKFKKKTKKAKKS